MNKLDNQSISKNFQQVSSYLASIIWNEQAGHPVDLYTISTRHCSSPSFFILQNVCFLLVRKLLYYKLLGVCTVRFVFSINRNRN
ncbi:hypothetical protein HanXRQr2_Chr15g0701541 [Helianthus annuus]|uniref:Uncharacterized protein n=2 Tax=Helianthus annuus TaxID=4232 RepID=A0A9K3E1G1_HELAN|nr:hypothetical protein HanXRQr2_Chr15g0701541 [Helianthus annuus]